MGVFRKYKDKDGRRIGPWFVQYPVERLASGKVKYRTVKASWDKKRAIALSRKKWDEFIAAERFGVRAAGEMSFSDLILWGLSLAVMKAKATRSDDKKRAEHLIAHFGELLAAQITPVMVDNFKSLMRKQLSKKTKQPFSGSSVNRMVSLARRIYYLAIDQGLLATNPFARRGAYAEPPTGKYVPDEEFWRLHARVRDYLQPVILTAYLTGMRRGELLCLTWERVDLFKAVLTLGEKDTKTREPRCIHFGSLPALKAVFVEAAKKRVKGQELVFTKPDGSPIPKWYISRLLKRACKDAGVGPYRLHDLRHTFNTNMSKAGVAHEVTMKLTGHKTLAMFLRYSHLDTEQAEGAMRSLGQLLFTGAGLPKKEEQEA